jgi:hypothetical protein
MTTAGLLHDVAVVPRRMQHFEATLSQDNLTSENGGEPLIMAL